MSLMLIATDGTETGATAANKINNAITETANNTQQISTNKLDIISLIARTSASETDINGLNDRLSLVEPIVTENTTNIGLLTDRVAANETSIIDLDGRLIVTETGIIDLVDTTVVLDGKIMDNTTFINLIDNKLLAAETSIINLDLITSTVNDTINDLTVRTNATEMNLSNINTRLSGVESLSYTGIVVKGATTQTVEIDTPTKVQWMQTVVLDGGKTAITADLITQEFIFGEDGIYKIQGTINIQAPTDDEIILELYVNGTPSTSKQYIVGKGITKPVTTSWFLTESFTTNDTISLFVTSSGTTVDVSYANLTIEKTAI